MRLRLKMLRSLPMLFSLCVSFTLFFTSPSFSAPLEKVSIQLQWMDQFQFAGYYMAKEKGFYKNAGLDVSILPFEFGTSSSIDDVVDGKAEFGTGRTSLLAEYFRGKPVVGLAAIFQDSPLILLARDDTGIKTPEDIRGRKVMIRQNNVEDTISIVSFLYMHGITSADYIDQMHSYDLKDLINKKTDLVTAYISNEPFRLKELGVPHRIFHPKDYGLTFYEDILFTSQDQIEKYPERTVAFTKASLEGWEYAFKHIDETANFIYRNYNSQKKSLPNLIYEGHELKKLAYTPGTVLGEMNQIKLKKIEAAYRLLNINLPKNKSLDGFIWAQTSPENLKRIYFTSKEQAFIQNTTVKAATTTNWPPFAFVNASSQKAAGIGFDYWQEIVTAAGLQTDIAHFSDFSKQLKSLKDKQVDLMYSSGITEDRLKYYLFTEPYAKFPISIATSKEENFIQSVQDLKGKKIAIGNNFTAHKMMLKAYPDLTYVPVKNAQEGLLLVSQGRAYAFVDIMPTLVDAINKHGFTNLKISGNTDLLFELRLMVRNDYPELVSIANKVIRNFSPDLKRQILNRWINVKYEQAFDYKKFLPYATAFVLIIAFIMFSLNKSRQRAKKSNKELIRHVDESSKELRNSKGQVLKLSQALEQSPSLVFITNTDGNIEYVNAKFMETTGYTRAEILGQNPRILKSDHAPRSLYVELWRTITAGETWRGEIRDRCKDGSLFWASVSVSPILNEDCEIAHFLAIHEDITKHKEAEAAMKLAVEQSEIANRSKTEMLANMSHELRTPLNAIIGFSDTMINQVFGPFTNEKYMEYANDINHSGMHLLELINDILDFSSIEAGKLMLSEDIIDIADVLNSSIRLIAPRLDGNDIEITTNYAENLPAIKVDKRRIKQIALNLLSNSAKFTKKGGHVSVKMALDEAGALQIKFADTGIGMTPKNLAIAMTQFGQVDGSLARKYQGTGLGLPLTKKLVEEHGGEFDIESETGVGTTVTITLPKHRIMN